MAVRFVRYTDDLTRSVQAFNTRLREGGLRMQYPAEVVPTWLPPGDDARLYQEPFVAVDERSEVRGGYVLKHQDFKIGEQVVPIADLRIPISEGAVNREYAGVATELLFNALAKQRLLFGMGIGGYDEAITKLFAAAGWHIFTIPFYFRIERPFRFCRRIRFLRRRWYRRLLLDVAAFSGLGWFGCQLLRVTHRGHDRSHTIRSETASSFGSWADELWSRWSHEYPMAAVRDQAVLKRLYPESDTRFHRLKVFHRDDLIGWVVVLDTPMQNHKQFGDLRVGSVVDAFSAPKEAGRVVSAAADYLSQRGVDLMVANHSHAHWGQAFRRAGFLSGPSNYLFAASRALHRMFRNADIADDRTFINRGDGDGPINL